MDDKNTTDTMITQNELDEAKELDKFYRIQRRIYENLKRNGQLQDTLEMTKKKEETIIFRRGKTV